MNFSVKFSAFFIISAFRCFLSIESCCVGTEWDEKMIKKFWEFCSYFLSFQFIQQYYYYKFSKPEKLSSTFSLYFNMFPSVELQPPTLSSFFTQDST